jgi:hypothetical protein
LGAVILSEYEIEISKMIKERKNGRIMTEIWARILNKKTCKRMNKRIWWEDENGIYHDGANGLPVELREAVDNAWIEKSRKW